MVMTIHDIKKLEDWYSVTRVDVVKANGTSFMKGFDTIHQMVASLYPMYK
jgi:hypothetical protein